MFSQSNHHHDDAVDRHDERGHCNLVVPEPKISPFRRLACMFKGEEYDPIAIMERKRREEQEKAERLAEISRQMYEAECAHVRELMKEAAQCAPGEECPAFDEIKAEWDDRSMPGDRRLYGLAYAYVQAQRSICSDDLNVSRELLKEVDSVWRHLEYTFVSRSLAVCYAEALLDLFNRETSLEERNRICLLLEDLEDASPAPEVELILRNVCRCLYREEMAVEEGEKCSKRESQDADFEIEYGVRVGFSRDGGFKAFLRQGRDERELARYTGSDTFVTVPDGVTAIDICAFKDCETIEEIFLPDSVKAIYKYAFSGCTNLRKLSGCKGLVYVGARIFPRCPNVRLKELPMELILLLDKDEERDLQELS